MSLKHLQNFEPWLMILCTIPLSFEMCVAVVNSYLPELSKQFGQRLSGVHRCHVGQGKVQEFREMGEGWSLEKTKQNKTEW